MARGMSSYTNSTITITTGGAYTGDGINGWTGGTAYAFAVKGRRTPLNRPREDTTDTGYGSGVGGPLTFRVELEGFFKSNTGATPVTIPPLTITNEFVHVAITIGFLLTAVVMVETFEPSGVIGTALSYRFVGVTDGTNTYA